MVGRVNTIRILLRWPHLIGLIILEPTHLFLDNHSMDRENILGKRSVGLRYVVVRLEKIRSDLVGFMLSNKSGSVAGLIRETRGSEIVVLPAIAASLLIGEHDHRRCRGDSATFFTAGCSPARTNIPPSRRSWSISARPTLIMAASSSSRLLLPFGRQLSRPARRGSTRIKGSVLISLLRHAPFSGTRARRRRSSVE